MEVKSWYQKQEDLAMKRLQADMDLMNYFYRWGEFPEEYLNTEKK